MTKKFWNNWQIRIGETSQIRVYTGYSWAGYAEAYYLLNKGDRIIKVDFHNDVADMIIERHIKTISGHIHIENEYITLHRNEIKTIEFYKYEKK